MKPTLVVLAAGMGSRYGGLKQVDPVGPSGEAILDYSVFDAIRGGFGKVVFIIRHDFEAEFKEKVGKKYEGLIPVDYCYQDLNDLPPPYKFPEGRTKPWGTAHAVRAARDVVKEPFAVINMGQSDDVSWMQPPPYPASAKEMVKELKDDLYAFLGLSNGETDVSTRTQAFSVWILSQFRELYVKLVECAQDYARRC